MGCLNGARVVCDLKGLNFPPWSSKHSLLAHMALGSF